MTNTQAAVLEWLANGRTGLSSETMAFYLAFGIKKNRVCHPCDPADLDRCLQLLAQTPGLRDNLADMKALSKAWDRLIARWDEIEQCHLDEVGLGWSKGNRAEKTYHLMRKVIGD